MSPSEVEFRLLGPLEVVRAGEVVDLGNGRERAVLGLLVLHPNQVVPVDRFLDHLWGESPPPSAAHALQVHISTLRKKLEPRRSKRSDGELIRTQRPGYLLVAGPDQLDVVQFERDADEGRRALRDGRPGDAAARLGAALARWRGPALADLAYESWAAGEAGRLEEARIAATEDRFEAELALGHHVEIVGELDAFARRHPLRERAWGQLMVALYRSGRQAEALRAGEALRTTLRDELGLDPSLEIRSIEAAVLDQDTSLDLDAIPRATATPTVTESPDTAARVATPAAPPRPTARTPRLADGRADEQKVITALFADVTGSTQLGETLEAEEFKVVVDEAVSRMITAVTRYGGTVVNVAGDGILALFGAPTVHEDDAERAVRAGMELVADVADYGEEIAQAWSVAAPSAHVGVHTGPAIVGSMGGGQVELTAMGDTINTAARLESAAAAGTVLVGASTRRALEPLFEFGPRQSFELKGKRDAVEASEVTAARAVRGNQRGIEGVDVELIGRQRELEACVEALDAVRAGTGGIVLLAGEAGLGKSRLLAELCRAFDADGEAERPRRWLAGRSLSYGERLPYWPFRELLRDWLGVTAIEPELRVKVRMRSRLDALFGPAGQDIQPFLGQILGLRLDADVADRVQSLSPQDLHQATVDAITTLLARLAADGPVAVALDDLHWADGDSIALVEALLDLTESAAVLIVIAQRLEREHPSWAVHDHALRQFPHRVIEVALRPLSAGDDAALLDALVGTTTLPVELREALLETAEGNPFFLEELVQSLVEVGALVRDESGWRLDHEIPVELPETVEKVIQSRIDRLPSGAGDTLTAASVLGRQFDVDLLAAIFDNASGSDVNGPSAGPSSPAEPSGLDGALRDLQRLEMIREAQRWPRAEYRFKHSLIQETAYRSLIPSRRRELHLRAARALEGRAMDGSAEDNGLLAHHFEEAGEVEPALRYHGLAAVDARAIYAYQSALAHYDAALRLIEDHASEVDLSEETIAMLAFGRGQVHRHVGRDEDAIVDLRRALDAARAADRPALELEITAELGMSELYKGTTVERAIRRFEHGLEMAEASGNRAAQAVLLGRLAVESVRSLRFDAALAQAEESLELARQSRDEVAVARALDGLKLVTLSLGDLVSFRSIIGELEEILRRQGDDAYLQFALSEHAVEASAGGRWTEAVALSDEAIELNRLTSDRAAEPLLLSMRTNLLRGHGLYGAALFSAIEANRLSVETSHHLWTAWASVNLCAVRLDLEDPEGALASLDQIQRIGEESVADNELLRRHAFEACARLRLGDRRGAETALAQADELRGGVELPPGRAFVYGFDADVAMARAHWGLGGQDEARAILDPLLAAADDAGWGEAVASTCLTLGELAIAVGDAEGAMAPIERSIEVSADGGLPGIEWRARAVAAGLHGRRGSTADAAAMADRADALVESLSHSLGDSPRAREFRDRADRRRRQLTDPD